MLAVEIDEINNFMQLWCERVALKQFNSLFLHSPIKSAVMSIAPFITLRAQPQCPGAKKWREREVWDEETRQQNTAQMPLIIRSRSGMSKRIVKHLSPRNGRAKKMMHFYDASDWGWTFAQDLLFHCAAKMCLLTPDSCVLPMLINHRTMCNIKIYSAR